MSVRRGERPDASWPLIGADVGSGFRLKDFRQFACQMLDDPDSKRASAMSSLLAEVKHGESLSGE